MNPDTSIATYRPPSVLFNGHLQTIYPALFRKLPQPEIEKRLIDLPDGDFLEYDHWNKRSSKAVIISHGLEGDSRRPYVVGMAKAFFEKGFDVIAWNYRGCGDKNNRTARLYHSGATDDLDAIVSHIRSGYKELFLIGFSLGGNLTLKYLGENWDHGRIAAAVVFSVPLDLRSGSLALHSSKNWLYEKRFLKALRKKIEMKSRQFPEIFDVRRLDSVRSLYEFDDLFTAPIHGFRNAEDYYAKCSSRFFLDSINIPTLVVNAKNDPMLTAITLDSDLGCENNHVTYEIINQGGHCGFGYISTKKLYWSERRALQFADTIFK